MNGAVVLEMVLNSEGIQNMMEANGNWEYHAYFNGRPETFTVQPDEPDDGSFVFKRHSDDKRFRAYVSVAVMEESQDD